MLFAIVKDIVKFDEGYFKDVLKRNKIKLKTEASK